MSLRKVWGKKGLYIEGKDQKRREQGEGYLEGAYTVSYTFPSWTWNLGIAEEAKKHGN